MKEIKAYIRPDMAERIIDGLVEAGLSGMTLINVDAIQSDLKSSGSNTPWPGRISPTDGKDKTAS